MKPAPLCMFSLDNEYCSKGNLQHLATRYNTEGFVREGSQLPTWRASPTLGVVGKVRVVGGGCRPGRTLGSLSLGCLYPPISRPPTPRVYQPRVTRARATISDRSPNRRQTERADSVNVEMSAGGHGRLAAGLDTKTA